MAGHGGTAVFARWATGLPALLAAVALLPCFGERAAQSQVADTGPGPLPSQAQAPDPLASDLMRADARLAEVSFVDPLHGWAVGDRGTIWHTDDGGNAWHLQRSGVSCRLESVSFVDENNGWAVGGYTHPYTHTSTGVVLTTDDGGRHWRENPRLLLPALRQIRFVNPRQGWSIGCPSAMFPSGVFFTEDGGRTWTPMPGARTSGWVAGDFVALFHGVLADRAGMAAAVRRGSVEPATTPPFGLRSVARMKLVPEVEPQVYGWLVGQGGLVMGTSDLGMSWQTPPGELPEGAEQFDFAALAVRGPSVWVAGSPGTCVFHSADAGRSWTALRTGQSRPIRSLSFVDDQHGWAAGDLGTILATSDGGQTWKRVHSGGTRAALLGIFSEPDQVPLELFAQLSGNEGYLGVVDTLNRRDLEVAPRDDVGRDDRLHEALVAVGACGAQAAWRFPLRQQGLRLASGQIVAEWDRANDGRGLDELKAHVVRQIRTWRPEVVVTRDVGASGDDAAANLVNQVVVEAVRAAADPTAFSDQITAAGLEAWQVKKVYAALPGGRGDVQLSAAELAERLGRSLADVTSTPRGLLEDRFRDPPSSLGFRLVVDNLDRRPKRSDFFAGIVLYPGGEARRELLDPAAETVDVIRRIAQKRRNVEAILDRTEKDPQGGLGFLAQTGDMTRGLDPDSSAQLLHYLGQRYVETGQWPMAADAFRLLVERHPEHPLSEAALVWLVQFYASSEAAWRVEGGKRFAVEQASALAPVTGEKGGLDPGERFAVGQASAPAIDFSQQEDRPALAAALGRRIEQAQPVLFAEPSLRFPLSVADRRRGSPALADRFFLMQSRSTTRDAWWACARGEQWLADPKGVAPKPVLQCVRAAGKPYLDGRLDDAIWQQARPAVLRSPRGDDTEWPAKVRLAYDAEFLYLAIEARRAPGAKYPPAGDGPRPRDPDLSGHDRVELLVDLDRDFCTYYRLTIDHRGWPRDECWGDSTWDPTWFVAHGAEENTWTAEAAIPLDQLTGDFPKARSVWAIGIQRVIPEVGLQSWNTPAAVAVVPEGFGYLIFE